MLRSKTVRAASAVIALLASSTIAWPAGIINVQVNQAKIVKLGREADTIIVGNPQIADASVQDSQTIVLTGKGFGTTNLVVLDKEGAPIVDQQISVSRDEEQTVRVYRRSDVDTYHCTPVCETAYAPPVDKGGSK